MIDVVNKTCLHEACNKQPAYNFHGETTGLYCVEHKLENMINVVSKTCAYEGCTIRPSHGYPGNKSTHCASHKLEGHILKPNAKCIIDNCKGQALYSNIGKSPLRCECHKIDKDINVVEKQCIECKFVNIVNPEGYCNTCRPGVFESFRLAKQTLVYNTLKVHNYYPFAYDKPILKADCGYDERPDLAFISKNGEYYVILEVDEHKHRGRPEVCECTRMVNITEGLMKPVLFIRYNPDEYKVGNTKKNPTHNQRMKVLIEHLKFALEYNIEYVNKLGCVVMKQMYYDYFSIDNCQWFTIK
jgi:hypothetical protein